MNELCVPIGLKMNKYELYRGSCVKKEFNINLEKNILNKIFSIKSEKKPSRKIKLIKLPKKRTLKKS